MDDETADKMVYLNRRTVAQKRRFYAQQPQSIGKVIGQLMLKRGYARSETNAQHQAVWAKVVGPAIAARTLATGVRRGKLEVTVAHSALVQELTFDQKRITEQLRKAMPEVKLTGVKYRVGKIEKK